MKKFDGDNALSPKRSDLTSFPRTERSVSHLQIFSGDWHVRDIAISANSIIAMHRTHGLISMLPIVWLLAALHLLVDGKLQMRR